MKEFTGISTSAGIVTGRAYPYIATNYVTPKYDIAASEIGKEHSRYQSAVSKATDEIKELKKKNKSRVTNEEIKLMDAHILMLNDPSIKEEILAKLKEMLKNVEWVLIQVIEDYIEKLNASKDPYLMERSIDYIDISQRLLRHLLYKERESIKSINQKVILVATNLLPSDIFDMNKEFIQGIITESGGKTSHLAILTKAFEIPAILGIPEITKFVNKHDEIILDATIGKVILQPDNGTKSIYEKRRKDWLTYSSQFDNLNTLDSVTSDGVKVNIYGNIEVPEEVKSVILHGADGIGLYRSEFLFIQPSRLQSEQEQFDAYSHVLKAMGNKTVTIRTVDFGGTKIIPGLNTKKEENPILGWRAVRFYISRPEIFKTQVRALLRASVFGDLRIMFPMISGIEELDTILAMVDEVKDELSKKDIPFKQDLEIGIMIEVPSAALICDLLAKKVKFFSIGTNDLIQYTIAVDRLNERVAYLYQPFHPAILRLIKNVIDTAREKNVRVEMCGEMASNPKALVVLVGLGLMHFSMSSIRIPEIKKTIRSLKYSEITELSASIMKEEKIESINKLIKNWMEERLDFNPSEG
jgi:phosphotransferase system enzyme I (PtsI)